MIKGRQLHGQRFRSFGALDSTAGAISSGNGIAR